MRRFRTDRILRAPVAVDEQRFKQNFALFAFERPQKVIEIARRERVETFVQ